MTGKVLEGSGSDLIYVLSWHEPGETDKDHEQESRRPGRYSKRAPPAALPPATTCSLLIHQLGICAIKYNYNTLRRSNLQTSA